MQALSAITQTPKQDVGELEDKPTKRRPAKLKVEQTKKDSPKPLFSAGTECWEVNSMNDLRPGQHIAVFRANYVRFYHHGIYVAHNQVIDFGPEGVQKKSYYDFEDGCRVYAVDHDDEDLPNLTEILRRANWALKHYDKPYNVATNNCEHFATFITTNQRESQQVQRVAAGAGVAIAGAAVAAVGYAMYKPNKK